MKVVNLRQDSYTIYIGRAGHGLDGVFGNPVKLNVECIICSLVHETRSSTLDCYEVYLRNKLKASSAFKERFLSLYIDDVLGCFCKPDACHGDVMIKVWEEIKG